MREADIAERVHAAIRQHGLLGRGSRVLVGFSGGADSTALLHLLCALAPRLGLTLVIAHLHHGIRGRAADEDARWARKIGRKLGLRTIVGRADVPALARRASISIEMAARQARNAFFLSAARRARCSAVALAHTADDQAETVLMRLARGAGLEGLRGIARSSAIEGLRRVRPLRDVRRVDLETWLRRSGIAWREDETNRDVSILRNRVRHQILPLLEAELNPRVREALCRAADLLEGDNALLNTLAETRFAQAARGGELDVAAGADDAGLDLESEGGRALWRRVIRKWLTAAGAPAGALEFEPVERVLGLLRCAGRGKGMAVSLPGNWEARRSGARLRCGAAGRPAPGAGGRLSVPGRLTLPGLGLRVIAERRAGIVRERGKMGHYPAEASVSSRMLGRRCLRVRTWRPGDRIEPWGLDGSRKLQDVFTDAKVPRAERDCIPVFECGGRVVWVPGYRIARGWAVESERAPAVRLRVLKQ